MTRRTRGLVLRPGKEKIYQKKNVSQTSATTETLEEALQKIEVEWKCVEKKKWRENASIWRKNASIPDKNYNKEERFKIIYEEKHKRIVADLSHYI